jgi:hypothetical protein
VCLAHWQPVARAEAGADNPEFCLAVRGNGYKVPVTLAAMARLSEEFGVADVVLGTSSGSIAAFLYENILLNPAIHDCGAESCSNAELGRRLSLALKSMLGFADFLRTTRGGRTVDRIADELQAGERPGFTDVMAALRDPRLSQLLNGRAILPSAAVFNPFNWPKHFQRLQGSAGTANFGGGVVFEILLPEGRQEAVRSVSRRRPRSA